MCVFIIMIIIGIIGIISSYFPAVLSALTLYGLLFWGFFLAVVSFILMIVEKKKWIWYLLSIFVYIIYIFLLPNAYHYLRESHLVKEHLKEFDVSGKIMGIDKEDYKFGDYDSCLYVFNVKLEDGENVVLYSRYYVGRT